MRLVNRRSPGKSGSSNRESDPEDEGGPRGCVHQNHIEVFHSLEKPPLLIVRSLRLRHRLVEELHDHWDEILGTVDDGDVSGAGEDGELRIRQPSEIADYATAEEAKHLDRVLGA